MRRDDFRGLRGLAGMSVTWAVLWIPLGCAAGIVQSLTWNRPIGWRQLLSTTPEFAVIGAICGFLFGVVFHLAERRRSFGDLTTSRIAVWGLLAGLAIPGGYAAFNGLGAAATGLVGYGVMNTIAAIATLMIARRAQSSTAGASPAELPSPMDVRPNRAAEAVAVRKA